MHERERSALQRSITEIFDRRGYVLGVYLFGSRARGDETPTSDADFAIVSREPLGLDELVTIEQELRAATDMSVDVVDLARASAFLALEAIRGERLFERDGLYLDEFELFVLRRAGDLAPFERERRRFLLSATRQS